MTSIQVVVVALCAALAALALIAAGFWLSTRKRRADEGESTSSDDFALESIAEVFNVEVVGSVSAVDEWLHGQGKAQYPSTMRFIDGTGKSKMSPGVDGFIVLKDADEGALKMLKASPKLKAVVGEMPRFGNNYCCDDWFPEEPQMFVDRLKLRRRFGKIEPAPRDPANQALHDELDAIHADMERKREQMRTKR
ncbi:hypothetical protein QQZ08_005131 [Neonectria magnoliae]|uniref:Uncharacterized protein n=1 Tax=Neonectria magnoliae TaxID=2732573 RepID=A0ABR1I5S6_9HYPO